MKLITSQQTQLSQIKSNISACHLIELDNMSDKQLIDTWKIYSTKSKKFKVGSKDNISFLSIANYAMFLHKKNLAEKLSQ
jgi:hypothetical protein